MALVPELQDHGCSLRGNVICKYITGEVVRCADCEYKKLTDNGRMNVAIDFYKKENVLDDYPIVSPEGEQCELCRGAVKNKATTKAYAKITNKKLDVKRDLAGSGGAINGGELDIIVPACTPCLKNFKKVRLYSYAIIVLVILMVSAITIAMNLAYPLDSNIASMFIFLVSATLGVGAYIGLMKLLSISMAKKTFLNVFDLPKLRGFKQRGWYVRRGGSIMPTLYAIPPQPMVDPLRPEENEQPGRKRAREEKA